MTYPCSMIFEERPRFFKFAILVALARLRIFDDLSSNGHYRVERDPNARNLSILIYLVPTSGVGTQFRDAPASQKC